MPLMPTVDPLTGRVFPVQESPPKKSSAVDIITAVANGIAAIIGAIVGGKRERVRAEAQSEAYQLILAQQQAQQAQFQRQQTMMMIILIGLAMMFMFMSARGRD